MDTATAIFNVIGDLTGPIGAALGIMLGALHLKNAGHITALYNTVAGVARDVAVVTQTVTLNHAALPLAIASGVAKIAQDTGVPAKLVEQVQAGAGQAAAILPVGEALLQVEAPSVEEKAHAILDQVGQVANALLGVTKQMQATAAAQASVASPPAPALAQPSAGG